MVQRRGLYGAGSVAFLNVFGRQDEDGTLVYSLPLAPDARMPFVNPFASIGPVGATMGHCSCQHCSIDWGRSSVVKTL